MFSLFLSTHYASPWRLGHGWWPFMVVICNQTYYLNGSQLVFHAHQLKIQKLQNATQRKTKILLVYERKYREINRMGGRSLQFICRMGQTTLAPNYALSLVAFLLLNRRGYPIFWWSRMEYGGSRSLPEQYKTQSQHPVWSKKVRKHQFFDSCAQTSKLHMWWSCHKSFCISLWEQNSRS